ncbi:MAG: prolyl oligopeptidase family serine peptidase, partial [Planctomycetota bacterium]
RGRLSREHCRLRRGYGRSRPCEACAPGRRVDAAEEGVFVVDLAKLQTRKIHSGRGEFGQVVFSKDGKQLAFLSNVDDYSAEKPKWSLYHWKQGGKGAKKVVDHETKGIPAGWIIASSTPNFFENGKRLVLNLRPEPEEKEEKKDEDENAVLDIWHWQDPFLQPQQKLRAAAERSRTYETILDLGSRRLIPVETEEIPDGQINTRSDAMHVLVTSSKKYDKMLSWDIQGFSDWYLVDLKTGKRSLVAEKRRGSPSLSPEGKFIYWWDGEQKTWHCMTAKDTENSVDLGKAMGVPVFNELHDQPSLPRPYGMAGWTADDSSVLIYDRWDIWQVDPTGEKKAVCLTNKAGRQTQTVYRYQRLDSEQRFLDLGEALLLSTTDHRTKASGFSRLEIAAEEGKENTLVSLIQLDESLGQLRKAKKSDAVVFSRSTFERFPDLWASTLEFKTTRRMTKANPQQDDFYWGSAELVHWKAKDGQPLDGILYKPEGFSPDKKYPLMVYFYERYSDRLHSYYAPAAGRSIINFSFYASRGYVIFVPDIPYKVGEPGPSAANAILPGVESIVSEGYIDEKRIGMQGHSWGGYQTAYLVTVTDMFACAESGAPVSNMTSAYGGIRWGSGMSRMFQYEKTQSRIGGTLWEARDKYLLNSPLFAADKVNTPLLILHNDEDTAVPWYQGIELFVALRRLEKPAWMLNYNGDPHWVMSDANRMDFATRMQQFFDHYLKGDPMPVWMADGIPAVDKGKEFGFEYVRPKKEAAQEEAADGEDAAEEEISPSDRK